MNTINDLTFFQLLILEKTEEKLHIIYKIKGYFSQTFEHV